MNLNDTDYFFYDVQKLFLGADFLPRSTNVHVYEHNGLKSWVLAGRYLMFTRILKKLKISKFLALKIKSFF